MSARSRRALRWLAVPIGLAAGAYAAHAVTTWLRYGRLRPGHPDARDPLLDRFMPEYEVVERHHIRVLAPPEVTMAAAAELDMQATPVVRAIIRGREILLGANAVPRLATGLFDELEALGWGVLADVPGRERIVGAVTRPWEPNVVFHAVAPEAFAAFDEPGYAKIAVTFRADPVGDSASIFRTETRVATTDADARARFRRYWALLSPGIIVIRWAVLRPLKRAAEGLLAQ